MRWAADLKVAIKNFWVERRSPASVKTHMRAGEIKWGACAFVGGFLLCYSLFVPFRPQPSAPRLLTTIPPALRSPAVPAGTEVKVPNAPEPIISAPSNKAKELRNRKKNSVFNDPENLWS